MFLPNSVIGLGLVVLEVGHGSGSDSSHSQPADILVPNWLSGKPAAFDLTVVSPLNSKTLN